MFFQVVTFIQKRNQRELSLGLSFIVSSKENNFFPLIFIKINHTQYSFHYCDWCISCVILHHSFYTFVVGQFSVIGHL